MHFYSTTQNVGNERRPPYSPTTAPPAQPLTHAATPRCTCVAVHSNATRTRRKVTPSHRRHAAPSMPGRRPRRARRGLASSGSLSRREAAKASATAALLSADAANAQAWLGKATASVEQEIRALRETVMRAGKVPQDASSSSDLRLVGRSIGSADSAAARGQRCVRQRSCGTLARNPVPRRG